MKSNPITRRNLLVFGGSALLLSQLPKTAQASETHKIIKIVREPIGTTLTLMLDNAPFPAVGAPYKDSTVMVFVPAHHRALSLKHTSVIVHFHGHNSTAESAMRAHRLREQLVDSRQNAILIVPQGPVMSADSSAGKLEADGGLSRLLIETLDLLAGPACVAALGSSGVPPRSDVDHLCLSAHSGGYHAAAACLRKGGCEVNEVYLFDALYGDTEAFRDWAIAGRSRNQRARHKLVSYTTGGNPQANTQALFAELKRAGVDVAEETVEGSLSRERIVTAQAVAIKSGLSHGEVTHELNGMRDCLYASGLHRRLATTWFEHKNGPRKLERR